MTAARKVGLSALREAERIDARRRGIAELRREIGATEPEHIVVGPAERFGPGPHKPRVTISGHRLDKAGRERVRDRIVAELAALEAEELARIEAFGVEVDA